MDLVFTWPEGSATLSFTATYGYLRDLQRSELTAMPSFHWKSTSFNTAAQASCEKQYAIPVFRLTLVSVLVTVPGNSFIYAGRQKKWSNGNRENKGHKQDRKTSGQSKMSNKGTQVSSRCIKMGKWLFVARLTSLLRHSKWACLTLRPAHAPQVLKQKMGAMIARGARGTQGNSVKLKPTITMSGDGQALDSISPRDGHMPGDVLCSSHLLSASLSHHSFIGYNFHFADDRTQFQRA